MHGYDQQRRTRCGAWCEERARAAAGAGAVRQVRGVLYLNKITPEKQGRVCERSGMEASASEPECSGDEQSRPIYMSAKPSQRYVLCSGTHRRPLRPLRTASPCSHLLYDRLPYSWLKPCFSDIPAKNDPHIGVLAAFPGSGWGKLSGKKQLDLKGLTSH